MNLRDADSESENARLQRARRREEELWSAELLRQFLTISHRHDATWTVICGEEMRYSRMGSLESTDPKRRGTLHGLACPR